LVSAGIFGDGTIKMTLFFASSFTVYLSILQRFSKIINTKQNLLKSHFTVGIREEVPFG
jgi:hypothetical protein